MRGVSLTDRAVRFALAAGAIAFLLALLAIAPTAVARGDYARALIPAIVCAAMCWAATQHAITTTATAVDAVSERIARVADSATPARTPPSVHEAVPVLAQAMDRLFDVHARQIEELRNLATYDPVTGLLNRGSFREAASRGLYGAQLAGAMFFIDLDRFKAVNDTRGHAAGDQLLAMVATRLRTIAEASRVGAHAIVGRLAGDEFTILLPTIDDADEAGRVAQRIQQAIDAPFALGESDVSIGASIGVAIAPRHGATLPELMRAADVAMYRAKALGGGSHRLYSAELTHAIDDHDHRAGQLRDALSHGSFALLLRPQIALTTNALVTTQATAHWRHPVDGIRPFTSLAQEAAAAGLGEAVDERARVGVLNAMLAWAKGGAPGRLSLHLDERCSGAATLIERLIDDGRKHGVVLGHVEIELAETVIGRASTAMLEVLASFRAAGGVVTIDGFGTGFSCLTRLPGLPVDRVKLDPALVREIARDDRARALTQSVIGFIHGMGCEAIADGVDDADQAEVLRVIGCDAAQGDWVGPAMDEADYRDWLSAPRAPMRAITSA